jgi:penicillin-binding protein-related factor A (putative recombinase)
MKLEAKWQTVWNQYVREKKFYGYFELKQTNGSSIPFDSVEDHQLEGLSAAKTNGFVWKLSDADMRTKPFDSFYSPPSPAFVVIKFPDGFYIIPVDRFISEKEISMRKSLTFDRAKKLSYRVLKV